MIMSYILSTCFHQILYKRPNFYRRKHQNSATHDNPNQDQDQIDHEIDEDDIREGIPRRRFTMKVSHGPVEGLNADFILGLIGALVTILLVLATVLALVCYRNYKKNVARADYYHQVS